MRSFQKRKLIYLNTLNHLQLSQKQYFPLSPHSLSFVCGKVKMMTTQHNTTFISPNEKLPSFSYGSKRSGGGLITVKSKRRDFPEKSEEKRPLLQIKVPNTILAQSAIAVLSLGFIDAGYSGDWSRIGVISKETEQLLKIGAFLLVPLSIFLALSFTNDSTD